MEGEMAYTSSLTSVIATLLLRHIRSMPTHRSRHNPNPASLLSKYQTRSPQAVVSAVKVDGPDPVPVLHCIV